MYLERYAYMTSMGDTHVQYEFISVGPQGLIKKIIRFDLIDHRLYYLGFGDLDPETGKIMDVVTSNNSDREKVLSTVAAAVIAFTEIHPDARVFAEGSTPARTRLYRICISKHWPDVTDMFHVAGLLNDNWEPFKKDKEYTAFLGKRK